MKFYILRLNNFVPTWIPTWKSQKGFILFRITNKNKLGNHIPKYNSLFYLTIYHLRFESVRNIMLLSNKWSKWIIIIKEKNLRATICTAVVWTALFSVSMAIDGHWSNLIELAAPIQRAPIISHGSIPPRLYNYSLRLFHSWYGNFLRVTATDQRS